MALKDYLEDKPVLETNRILMREFNIQDAEDLKEWLGDSELYTYWGRAAHDWELNPELKFHDPRPHVKRKPIKDFIWGIVLKETGKVIGEIQVFNIENDRMAKVAYRLSKKHWGKGLTTEALAAVVKFCFEKTELQRLWSDVDARNIASCKILERNGFTKEGYIRQGKMVSSYCDYYLYGMLRNDYIAK